MEETGLPGENHQPVASHWQTLSHNVLSSTPRDWIECKSCAKTFKYELLFFVCTDYHYFRMSHLSGVSHCHSTFNCIRIYLFHTKIYKVFIFFWSYKKQRLISFQICSIAWWATVAIPNVPTLSTITPFLYDNQNIRSSLWWTRKIFH